MSSGFNEKDYGGISNSSRENIVSFLNDLRALLDKHGVKLYSNDCELFINGMGFVGYLEDNIETVEIVDGDDVLYASKKVV